VRRAHVLAVAVASFACNQVEPDPYSTYTGYPYPVTAAGDTTDDGATAGTGSATGSTTADTDGSTSSVGADTSGDDATAGTSGMCTVGAEGCPCTGGGGCDPGLACLSTVCVDPGALCPVGTQGCPCTVEMSCEAMLVCIANECVVDE
jgi:hypothetical protein